MLYILLGLDYRLESIQTWPQGFEAGSRLPKQDSVLCRHGVQCCHSVRLDLVYTPCWRVYQGPKLLLRLGGNVTTVDLEFLYVFSLTFEPANPQVRVETEHLGNADAYRVTREIPLPYRRIEHDSDSDEPLQRTKSSTKSQGISLHLSKLRRRLEDPGNGKPEEVASPKPGSGYRQRQYEAWRPKDKPAHGEV